MEIDLTPEQADFVRLAVSAGRLDDPTQAVQEAMALWVYRERQRIDLLASLDLAEASLARGEGVRMTSERMNELARDVIDRARARLDKTQTPGT